MRAMVVSEYGKALTPEELPVPAAGRDELLVRVHSCAINFADLLLQNGRYQERPELPFSPGMEICGTVEEAGENSGSDLVGSRVAAYCGFGGMAEYISIPSDACIPVPERMPSHIAAAFPIVYGTSHVALSYGARLQSGERLLVLGAAGGVGISSVELGKVMGAEVIGSARGHERLEHVRKAGADHVLESDSTDLRYAVKALGGADVVIDPIGGDSTIAALRACNPGGRLVPIGFACGEIPQIPANVLLVKNLSVIGVYWGAQARLWPSRISESLKTLLNWYDTGQIKPCVSHRFSLERANEALDLLRSRKSVGKIVIDI